MRWMWACSADVISSWSVCNLCVSLCSPPPASLWQISVSGQRPDGRAQVGIHPSIICKVSDRVSCTDLCVKALVLCLRPEDLGALRELAMNPIGDRIIGAFFSPGYRRLTTFLTPQTHFAMFKTISYDMRMNHFLFQPLRQPLVSLHHHSPIWLDIKCVLIMLFNKVSCGGEVEIWRFGHGSCSMLHSSIRSVQHVFVTQWTGKHFLSFQTGNGGLSLLCPDSGSFPSYRYKQKQRGDAAGAGQQQDKEAQMSVIH